MKKLLIAGLSAAVLLVTSSIAFAANPTGKVTGFYSPATNKVEFSSNGSSVSQEIDASTFGVFGDLKIQGKFGAAASYVKGTGEDVSDNDLKQFDDKAVSIFNIDGTYNLVDSKDTGKIDLTLGYVSATSEKGSLDKDDVTLSGFAVGAKGNYDFGNKFSLDYKLSYAPSMDVDNDNVDKMIENVSGLQYRVGVDYEVNKQFSVGAGYQGNKISYEYKNSSLDGSVDLSGFYLGGSVKF